MKIMKVVVPLCVMVCSKINAQSITPSVVNTAGGVSNHITNMQWSVGELSLVNTLVSGNESLIITSGFLQADVASAINKDKDFTHDELKILPNPTYGVAEVRYTNIKGKLLFEVYDASGKLLIKKQAAAHGNGIEKISLEKYANGTYLFKIILQPATNYTAKKGYYKIVKI